ncbi:probable choline kinase 2 [Miscanthus floridulus]|uniref:probable choline kinase 2 n=1 Tax=Miscanthus floridulus TaxID=154761 RepID=UPI0034580920
MIKAQFKLECSTRSNKSKISRRRFSAVGVVQTAVAGQRSLAPAKKRKDTDRQAGSKGDEIAVLEKTLSGVEQSVGFCHNDLQYGNIMIYEETRQVTLIDYEYASFNPIAFDIANHFCEMAADYHTATPHMLDFSKYPDIEEQRRFVQTYLSSAGEKPSDGEVEKLLGLIAKYTLASHLFWGLWGIISAHVNKNIDFEYKEYARQRLDQYWQTKPGMLGPN